MARISTIDIHPGLINIVALSSLNPEGSHVLEYLMWINNLREVPHPSLESYPSTRFIKGKTDVNNVYESL